MRALTVKNPWALFIALKWKRIENRNWAPPAELVGKRIAIHAGAGKLRPVDHQELHEMLRGELLESFTREFVRLKLPQTDRGYIDLWEATRGRIVAGATIKAVHTSRETVPEDQRVWWVGSCAWELSDLQRVTGPVIKGALGLWDLPKDYAAEKLDG